MGLHGIGALLTLGRPGAQGGGALPIVFDFSTDTLDGWDAATWSIVGGKASNDPTLGDNQIPADESTFEGSGVYAWTPFANNLAVNDANTLKITYVDSTSGAWRPLSLSPEKIYLWRSDAKRTGDTCTLMPRGAPSNLLYATYVDSDEFESAQSVFMGCNQIYARTPSGAVLWLDNLELREVDTPFAFVPEHARITGDLVTRITLSGLENREGSDHGLILCADSTINPQNYILVALHRSSNWGCRVWKVVGGTASLLQVSAGYWTEGAALEVRRTGNTFQVYWNGAQEGDDLIIDDAGIVGNSLHGLYSVGGDAITNFFLGKTISQHFISFLGASATSPAGSYAHIIGDSWLPGEYIDRSLTVNYPAANGQRPWEHLIRLYDEAIPNNPSMVSLAIVGNTVESDFPILEAFIRRVRAVLPRASILWPCGPYFYDPALNNPTLVNAEIINNVLLPLGAHYDLKVINYAQIMSDLVANGDNVLEDWYDSPDGVHPTPEGQQFVASLVIPHLTPDVLFNGAGQWSGDLADYPRIDADSVLYERDPIRRAATDNDGETGTGWTTVNDTERQSSTAGDTITFTDSFCSFGVDVLSSGGPSGVEYKLDDGDWSGGITNIGYRPLVVIEPSITDGPHTVTFRVISGTVTIRRFLAI